ncbi:branched-chain amino acid ABC transporter permease [Streptomyces luteolus]|uniref:Branched-chain amino acid ABC transporter permease n=1 Tax=Streptomyces luteolus TaxID=3043615 RepID=A0ABT6SPR7_9ACTN|nr:branched-chain amino acid ABC transporter permease [Streptomyces sp. B-S-A12]MDI3417603.1 branched-chain amino acid ABC transporter permease [Streptomyces sp. B-S-A12]
MEQLLQLLVAGLALGARYALVTLGFVVIFRATGVINFAQGSLVLLGAYLTYQFAGPWQWPFLLAAITSVIACGACGPVIERLLLRRMVGRPAFAVIMVTLGLLIVIEQAVPTMWGQDPKNMGDPWGIDTVQAGAVTVAVRDLWTLGLTALAIAGVFGFFRYSRYGLAMRATALDQEAAQAQGISVRRVVALSWTIAGAAAALAGITVASGEAGVSPSISQIALAAFPAAILGGLDSPYGAIAGGLVIGVSQTLTAGYQPDHAAWLGDNFHVIMPYVVMIAILLVRPYGLFGTREVERA